MVLTERCWAKKTLGFWTLSFDSLGSLFVGVVKTPNITTSQIRDVLSTAMDISWDMPTFRSQSQTLQWKTAWSPLLLSLRQKSSGICLSVKKSRSLMRKVYKYNWCKVCKYNWKKTIEKRNQPDSLLEIFEVLWLWIVPVVWIIRGVAHLQAQMKWNWEKNKKNLFPGGLFGRFSPPWSPPSQHRCLWMDSQYFLNYATSLWLERSNVICNIAENRVLTLPFSDSQMKSQQWATLLFT